MDRLLSNIYPSSMEIQYKTKLDIKNDFKWEKYINKTRFELDQAINEKSRVFEAVDTDATEVVFLLFAATVIIGVFPIALSCSYAHLGVITGSTAVKISTMAAVAALGSHFYILNWYDNFASENLDEDQINAYRIEFEQEFTDMDIRLRRMKARCELEAQKAEALLQLSKPLYPQL